MVALRVSIRLSGGSTCPVATARTKDTDASCALASSAGTRWRPAPPLAGASPSSAAWGAKRGTLGGPGSPPGEASLAPGSGRSCAAWKTLHGCRPGGRRSEFRRGSRRRTRRVRGRPATKRALFCAPPGSWNQWIGGS